MGVSFLAGIVGYDRRDSPVVTFMSSLLNALAARGLLAQVSDRAALEDHLASGQRTLYVGFDPTAPSLQVGNLVPLLVLRRAQLHGHRPIVVVGGATGLIGDPSGRADERALQDAGTIAEWVESIRAQVARFIDVEGAAAGRVVNNLDWTRDVGVIDFLRDVGKHFSVNAMTQRDSVRTRLTRDGEGISYTEFSYMLLQAYDFLELARRYDCTVQLGGSDQWGNIVSGVDLVRRVLRRQAYALTTPLATRQDGAKFGKSAAGAVWLDATRTSPYAFYQFWMNVADADVGRFLRCFTLLEDEAIGAAEAAVGARPEERSAQRLLAAEATRLVHGDAAAQAAQRITKALFSGDVRGLASSELALLAQDGMATTVIDAGEGLLAALARAGLAASNSAARRLVGSGGLWVNGVIETDAAKRLSAADALHGRYHVVRRGRKHWHMLVLPG